MINWYSDVDGVYNAYTDHRFDPAPRSASGWDGNWNPMEIGGAFPGWWSEEMVQETDRLIGHPLVSPRWLTTWEEGAPEQLVPALSIAGGAIWPVITGVEYDDPMNWQWWKLAALKNDLAATEPDAFIWIEDDVPFDPKAIQWLQTVPIPHLVISPKTAVGVTRGHTAEIEAFIGEISASLRTHRE
ncbi:HAD domain-containing protein [Arthrobacter sp. IK3]|uniref:HAD domain-containing protein n=1 Tax=Arthrobacter sp. IK3 TaxID=3448169 RepID=UPI003EE05370